MSQVYLNELKYMGFEIRFEDGKITSYSCKNFDDEAENQKLLKANVLFNHETLPLGEFAIGTNTTAYMVAKRYDIGAKLPILIAEKMGPHFAVGDTCYSWSEDNPVYNPTARRLLPGITSAPCFGRPMYPKPISTVIRILRFPTTSWIASGW